MSAFGSTFAANNNVELTMSQGTADFGYFLNSQTQGVIIAPGGSNGILCLAGSIGRYNQPGAAMPGPSFSLTLNLLQTPQPNAFVAIQAGETWNFTAWYRDVNPNATSNFTDAVSITFQ